MVLKDSFFIATTFCSIFQIHTHSFSLTALEDCCQQSGLCFSGVQCLKLDIPNFVPQSQIPEEKSVSGHIASDYMGSVVDITYDAV